MARTIYIMTLCYYGRNILEKNEILPFQKSWAASIRVQQDFPMSNFPHFQRLLQREGVQERDHSLHCWSLNQEWMADEERPMALPLIGGLISSCFICQSLYTILITFELCSVIHNDLKRQHCIFSICSELSKYSLILTASQGSSLIYGWENKIDWILECILTLSAKQRHEIESPPSVSFLWTCSS